MPTSDRHPLMADPLRAFAPAKVNLSLRITGRRADGYHLLDSMVAFADFGDWLSYSPAGHFQLTIDGPFADGVPTDDSNLVWRAATALANATGISPHGHVRLSKNLPAAGGIGGGSSDAAAALRLLLRAWDVTLSGQDHTGPGHTTPDNWTPELAELALTLGADVPVCLTAAACRMRGIGDDLTPLPPLPQLGIVLVNPGVACSTAAVFRARSGAYSVPGTQTADTYTAESLIAALKSEPNDLTQAARTVCPSVTDVLDALSRAEGVLLSRMSGSGATCFGLFPDAKSAEVAAATLAHPGWWVKHGTILP